jgi:intracellular sulfur oxidation DsrE/DsrF family protein
MIMTKGIGSASLGLVVALCMTGQASAKPEFEYGPVFSAFGKHAPVEGVSFTENQTFKVAFDVAKAAKPGEVNRKFESLARFINMHVANGVKQENLSLALVVHGSATEEMLKSDLFKQRKGQPNGNETLLAALMKQGVEVIVCGQSAAAHGVEKIALIEGVKMDLSAMTAHARLAQKGYSVNPF